jgi:ACT domain-containing protein
MKKSSKETVIKQLKKTPIVQVTCKKVGISRATFYRWKKEDKEFGNDAEAAIEEGLGLINDMAESQLISAIKDGNLTGIIFWLKNHHRQYSPKLEVTTKNEDIPLTDEQKELIRKSLSMAFAKEEKEVEDGKPQN